MKNSIYLIWKNSTQVLLFGFGVFMFLYALPSFAQISEQEASSLKASSPTGENVIISMLYKTSPGKNKYIQIYNADVSIIDLSGWRIDAIIGNGNKSSSGNGNGNGNGDEEIIASWDLSGTIKPGETKTAGDDQNQNFTPDFINTRWQQVNTKWNGNNTGAKLYKNDNLIDNALSTTDWSDGTLSRNENAGTATTDCNEEEWSVFSTVLDYQSHNCRLPIIDIGPGLWSELTTDFTKGVSYNIIGTVEVDLTDPAECYSVYIQKNNVLMINPLSALTINKNLNNYGSNAAFVIEANSSGSGSVIIHGISDNGTMEQYFEDTKLQNWEFISSPVEYAKSAIYENDYLMYYYEPQMRYVTITQTTTNLKVGRGYTVKKAQDNIEKYEGIFNAGEIQIPTLTNTLGTPYSTDEHSGWNLIGNPYPSSIDWDQVYIPSKVHGQVSVWVVTTENGETITDWKVWVKGFGDQEAHYIDPAESFFVFSDDTETISFDSDVQVHHFNEASTKSTPDPVLNEIMEVKATGNNFSSSFHLRFLEGSTLGFDPEYDAFKRLSESKKLPQIYNTLEETILAANSIPAPADDDVLHLAFSCGTEGTYTLDFSGIEGFAFEQKFYLKDNMSGEITNLRQEQTVEFNYKSSDPENRFDILFGLISGIDDLNEDEYETSIYNAAENIYIRTDYPQQHTLKVEIRNLLGQMVYSAPSISEFRNGKNLNLPNATYLVSISDEDYFLTKKIAVYN